MSKQAGEICIRCPKCGEFEVPVDWSKCARKEVQNVRCNKCGAELAYCNEHRGGRIVLARRKRKNFEARLKGRIMKNLEGWAEMQDCTKRMIRVYTNLLDASSFNSMCGQDVEGS